ncbi:MAG: hypothetical protein AB8G96_01005 [Phycisphaerales bacterium]
MAFRSMREAPEIRGALRWPIELALVPWTSLFRRERSELKWKLEFDRVHVAEHGNGRGQ